MKAINTFFENTISITDLREDIDVLTDRLSKFPYTVVFKNRSPFFIAANPEWFKTEVLGREEGTLDRRQKVAAYFRKVARQAGNWRAGRIVIDSREREKQKWTR